MTVRQRTGHGVRHAAVASEEPYVRSFEPSARMRTFFRIGNALLTPVLRSRLGRRMPELALLSFTGRRTGKRFTVPVGYYRLDGRGVVLTASRWKANLRGGSDVVVVNRGVAEPMRALLDEDPDEVADVYRTLLTQVGVAKAKLLGLRVAGDRLPTHQEMVAGIGGRRAVVWLQPR